MAAFLYCGGYLEMMFSASFRFSALNSNGIWNITSIIVSYGAL